MVCRRCGTDYPDDLVHCPKCGELNTSKFSTQTDNIENNIRVHIFSMKWYMFLLFVSMPLSFFMNLYEGIWSIVNPKNGMFELSAVEGYSMETLAKLNRLSGIVCIVMAVFAGYTWYNLKKRKKNSLLCINTMYIANMLSSVVFLSLMAFVDQKSIMDLIPTMFIMYIAPSLVMVGVNTVYFRKRSAFFNK